MSLRLFHIVFILFSTFLALLLGFWSLHHSRYFWLGILSFVCAAGLGAYGVWFYQKLKKRSI